MGTFRSKLYLDKHHSIERFGVTMLIIFVLMISVLGSIFVKKNREDHAALTTKAIYSALAETSLSKVQIEVKGIYRDTNQKKVFVLLKAADMKKLSTDASTYQVFVTALNLKQQKETMKSHPVGSIYIFGSTGYMGLYFVDNAGFESQIWKLTLRAGRTISDIDPTQIQTEEQLDVNSLKYDQAVMYLNAGGADAEVRPFLDNDETVSINDIYEALVSRNLEYKVRQDLNAELKNMSVKLQQITEYKERLIRQNVVVPEAPGYIDEDVILRRNAEDPTKIDPVDVNAEDGTVVKTQPADSEFAEDVPRDKLLYLDTKYVSPKGFNFNWQDGSVKQGYLGNLLGGLTPAQFFAKKDSQPVVNDFNVQELSWKYRNGGTIVLQGGSQIDGSVDEATVKEDIQLLTKAWTDYYAARSNYQMNTLRRLLVLEINVSNADKNYTENSSDKALIAY